MCFEKAINFALLWQGMALQINSQRKAYHLVTVFGQIHDSLIQVLLEGGKGRIDS